MSKTEVVIRCNWCENDPLMIHYHDEEWGKPLTQDDQLFEALTLEIFQAGLSWRTILHKRGNFRNAFDEFIIHEVAHYGADKVDELLQNKGIVRHRRKIEATVHNACVAKDLIKKYGSLHNYFQSLPEPLVEKQTAIKKTFRHVGLTTAESFLMAAGYTEPHHDEQCFLNGK